MGPQQQNGARSCNHTSWLRVAVLTSWVSVFRDALNILCSAHRPSTTLLAHLSRVTRVCLTARVHRAHRFPQRALDCQMCGVREHKGQAGRPALISANPTDSLCSRSSRLSVRRRAFRATALRSLSGRIMPFSQCCAESIDFLTPTP